MKILYDHQTFDIQKFGGISRYFSELISHIPSTKVGALISSNNYIIHNSKANVGQLFGNISFKGKNFIERNVNRYYSKYLIQKGDYDIFHPTYYIPYFLPHFKKKLVITVHDMIHERYNIKSTDDNTIENKKQLIYAADKIIAVSHNTKKDILEFYNISPDKIDVVYHGNRIKTKTIHLENQFGKYILYVGDRHSYKNFPNFIKACSILLKNETELKVICAGKPFKTGELQEIKDLQIENQVISITPNDQLLASLYFNAQMFVYPSLYEGFGIPILEAFENNCPVCLSNASCFPEIASNAAVYFDPNNIESMVNAMLSILNSEDLRQSLQKAGNERVAFFSWEKCAQETLAVYNQLI